VTAASPCTMPWARCAHCSFVTPDKLPTCQLCDHPVAITPARHYGQEPLDSGRRLAARLVARISSGDTVDRSLTMAWVAQQYGDGFAAHLRAFVERCEEIELAQIEAAQLAKQAKREGRPHLQ
jgi:hypothetical protein